MIAAARLNRRPSTLLESANPGRLPATGSFLEVTPATVMVSVLKVAEDDARDLVIRLHETAGAQTDAMVKLPLAGQTIRTTLRPQELRTFRIPADTGAEIQPADLLERRRMRTEE